MIAICYCNSLFNLGTDFKDDDEKDAVLVPIYILVHF